MSIKSFGHSNGIILTAICIECFDKTVTVSLDNRLENFGMFFLLFYGTFCKIVKCDILVEYGTLNFHQTGCIFNATKLIP